MNQTLLGKVLKLHQSAISRIESGEQKLTPEEIFTISYVFEVSIDDLFLCRLGPQGKFETDPELSA